VTRRPGREAVERAVKISDASPLRCVGLPDLIALKLYASSRRDLVDIVEVLARNPDANIDSIRTTCASYGYSEILETLIAEARA
jgi:hypothetical protein